MRPAPLLALVACGTKDAAPSAPETCKPLAVTVDGQPLVATPHGLARANNMHGDIAYEVQLFSNREATCDELLNKAGRHVAEDEVSVRAFAAGPGMTGKGVGIDAHTQMGASASLIGAPPKAVGDVVKICVDDTTFKPIAGAYKDKQVVVSGLFQGTYCGELRW